MDRHKRISSDDMPDACDSAQDAIWSQLDAARNAESPDEQVKLVLHSLDLVDRYLVDPKIDYRHQMYMAIAEFLGYKLCREQIWDWLDGKVSSCQDPHEREAMGITIFEVMGEDPVHEFDMDRLFPFLECPEARWAVFSAFDTDERFPVRLLEQYSKYVERCGSRGEEPARLDDAVLQEWIQEMRSPPE